VLVQIQGEDSLPTAPHIKCTAGNRRDMPVCTRVSDPDPKYLFYKVKTLIILKTSPRSGSAYISNPGS